jgi:hypothetical protein
MITGGVEVKINVLEEQLFGPVVLFGLAGAADVLADSAARLAPLTGADADDLPQITELDLSPVIARREGALAADARIRVQPTRSTDAYLRQLR